MVARSEADVVVVQRGVQDGTMPSGTGSVLGEVKKDVVGVRAANRSSQVLVVCKGERRAVSWSVPGGVRDGRMPGGTGSAVA